MLGLPRGPRARSFGLLLLEDTGEQDMLAFHLSL